MSPSSLARRAAPAPGLSARCSPARGLCVEPVCGSHCSHAQACRERGEAKAATANSAGEWVDLDLLIPGGGGVLGDLLDPAARFPLQGEACRVSLPPNGARLLRID